MKKITIPAVLFIVFGMTSCSGPGNGTGNIMISPMAAQNKDIVNKYMKAITASDTATMKDMLTDDFKDYGPARGDSSDKAQYMAIMENIFNSVSSTEYNQVAELAVNIKENKPGLEPAGDWVMTWGNLTANYKNGQPPATFKYHCVFQIKDGKIAMTSSYYDEADLMRQEGYKFIPPTDSTAMNKPAKN